MTNEPFEVALRRLLEERDLSIRGLAKRTAERHPAPEGEWSKLASVRPDLRRANYDRSPGLTHPYLGMLLRGELPTSPRACEIIADALNIQPEYFAEYRLDVARERLDWRGPDPETRHRRLALALRTLEEGPLR